MRRERIDFGATAGVALLVVASVGLAAAGPDLVAAATWVAERGGTAPGWLLGIFGQGLGLGGGAFYALLWVAFAGYLLVVWRAPRLGRGTLWRLTAALVILFGLAPPLLSQDVFSYIAYARLGVVHGLNPYEAVPAMIATDPVARFVGWPDAVSAYGPLFTLLSYPAAVLPVSVELWLHKAVAAFSLVGIGLVVERLAVARGASGERALAFVCLNPIALAHVVGGGHNDALMALALVGATACLASSRERAGGALLVGAAAIKLSALYAAPFAAIDSLRRSRRAATGTVPGHGRRGLPLGRLALGAWLALAGLALATALAFGSAAFDSIGLVDQNQSITSRYSLPATLSRLLGADLDAVRTVALALFGLAVAGLAAWTWRGGDWIRAAAWAGLATLLATGWLLPWYLIWVLPLAAVARDRPLAVALLALTAFQLISRVPL